VARWKAPVELLLSVIEILFYLLPLRRYKAKCVTTRCFQDGVGHLQPRFLGKGSPPCQYIDTTRKAIDCATTLPLTFLANVNSRSRSLYAIVRLSVVCNVGAPYSGGSNFRQCIYGIRYLGHPLTSTENFTEIVPGEPRRLGS